MQITLRQAAEPGVVLDEHALDANIGKRIRVNVGAHATTGTVVGAKVIEDGRAMEVTVEVPDDEHTRRLEAALAPDLDRFSIGMRGSF